MASLKERGRYYYIRFSKNINGERHRVTKSLGIRYKEKALEALEKLEEMEERGEIDPYSDQFDPQKIITRLERAQRLCSIFLRFE